MTWICYTDQKPNEGTVFLINLCPEHPRWHERTGRRFVKLVDAYNYGHLHYRSINCPHCYWMYLPDVPTRTYGT